MQRLGYGLTASLMTIAIAAQPAHAQVVPAEGASPVSEDDRETITVTGSRIASPGLTSVSPIATVDAEVIALDRALNIESVLNRLPQFVGSFGGSSNGADARGAATADLRGLGQNRTLVLIDGTRGAPFGFRNSVDLNSIPAPLVERVDVLTGGAAAVYGADAVAGVVNFILKKDFEGVEATALYNVSERGDATSYGANITFGTGLGGRGNVSGYLGWSERTPVFKSERGFASPERTDTGVTTARPLGGFFRRSDSANVFNLAGVGGAALGNTFGFQDSGAIDPVATSSVLSPTETLIISQQRFNAAVFFNYELTDSIEAYGRGMYSRSESRDALPPATVATNVLIRRDNPFLTPQLQTILAPSFNRTTAGALGGTDAVLLNVTRSFGELGQRTTQTTRNSSQGQIGLRGDIGGGARFDVYGQYGVSDESSPIFGEGLLPRFQQAANATVGAGGQAVCADPAGGCIPANIFGPGSISKESAGFFGLPIQQGRKREQWVAAATISGDTSSFFRLPGGGIGYAVGIEYRDERGENTFDAAAQAGLSFNQGTRVNFDGGYDVKDVYGEVRLPLLANVPFFHALNLEGAYRYSDYSTSGGVDAWKLGGDWSPVPSLRIRGSYQRVVRAPNIGELFGATSSIPLLNVVDPCANPAASGAAADVCTATGAPAGGFVQDLTGALFLFGGRATIQPERGKTWTAGAVFTPGFLPGLTLSGDYYDIRIENAIGAVLPQATLNTCFIIVRDATDPFCANVQRRPNGQLAAVDSSDINVANLNTRGVDVVGNYDFALGATDLGLSYAGSLVISQQQQNGVTAPVIECAGRFGATCGLEVRRALPRYRHRVDGTVGISDVTLRATWRLEGAVRDDAATVFLVERIGPQHYLDAAMSFDVNEAMRFIIGVDNLLDRRPPLAGTNAADANTFPQSYDVIGRRFGVAVTLRQ